MRLAIRPPRCLYGADPSYRYDFLLLLFFLLGSDFVTYGQSRLPRRVALAGEQRCPARAYHPV